MSSQETKEQYTEINRFEAVHQKLHNMVKKGLAYHQCGLFHDQLIQITQLKKMGIQPRGGQPVMVEGGLASVSAFCSDMHEKLGCAHAGTDEEIYDGYMRAKMSTARLVIIEGIELLRQYAPEHLSEMEANTMKKAIEVLGLQIAVADVKMTTNRKGKNETINNHNLYTESVFKIAKTIDDKIAQAVAEGKGREKITIPPESIPIEDQIISTGMANPEAWEELRKLAKEQGLFSQT